MTGVQYIGRKSEHFFGKYLSEIVRNLKNRGQGRLVVKETEAAKYREPCFYVIDRAVPLLSDASNARCRIWAKRVFRGRDFGTNLIEGTHEPDWRLVPPAEASQLLSAASDPKNVAPDVPVRCVAAMPPLLAIHLRRAGRFPPDTIKSAELASQSKTADEKEADGFLLLTKIPDEPEALQVPVVPSEEEQRRIYPPYPIASEGGLVRKRHLNRTSYYIRRSDTPGLYWKVELTPDNTNTEPARTTE